jgi:hypothetical protein
MYIFFIFCQFTVPFYSGFMAQKETGHDEHAPPLVNEPEED